MTNKPIQNPRKHYLWFCKVPTRWHDNDAFGHVNNAVYYTFFDTAITLFFQDKANYNLIDPSKTIVTVAAETKCSYFSSIAHPETVDIGIRCIHIGSTSSKYEIGVFRQNEDQPVAQGYLLHVHVDRTSMSPKIIPDDLKMAMQSIYLAQ